MTVINLLCSHNVVNVGEEGTVVGWIPSHRKHLIGIEYRNGSGTFHINLSGVYQVSCRKTNSFLNVCYSLDILVIVF